MMFINTTHCLSRLHCKACRQDANFRQQLIDTFGDFECPLNLPINATDDLLPEKAKQIIIPKCKFRGKQTEKPNPKRPCKGGLLECDNSDNPNSIIQDCDCNKQKCKFYQRKD